jgi:MFS family permease
MKKQLFYGYIVALAVFVIMIMWAGTRSAFGVFFKPIMNEFDWPRATLSGAFSLLWFIQGLLGILMGRLCDRFGPRIVMTICGVLMGIGHILTSQVSTIWQLYLFYGVVVGIGGSVYAPLVSTVAKWFQTRRSMVTGIVVAGAGLGSFLIPLLSSWLITLYDWRVSFVILGILTLVAMVVTAQFLVTDPFRMGMVPYGANEIRQEKSRSEIKGVSLREAVCTRQFWLLFAIFYCIGFCSYAVQLHIVPHATDLGISAVVAAQILALIGGLISIGRVVLGIIGDKIGNEKTYFFGFILLAVALLWLIYANEIWMLYLFAVIFGFAVGVGVLASPLAAEYFGLRIHGLLIGLITFGYAVGGAVGPFVAGYIFDTTGSYLINFIVNAIVAISGIIFTGLLTLDKGKLQKRTAT